eukprot:7681942-Alexandrium_andersonii.AAC.1
MAVLRVCSARVAGTKGGATGERGEGSPCPTLGLTRAWSCSGSEDCSAESCSRRGRWRRRGSPRMSCRSLDAAR